MAKSAAELPSLLPQQQEPQCCVPVNEALALPPEVLARLLIDHTTKQNIYWATDDYADRGEGWQFFDQISAEALAEIVPRALKSKLQQQQRIRDKGEVFTPSWICNKQNNLIDSAWFGREGVFNTEIDRPDGTHSWLPTEDKIEFPEGKKWQDYVADTRLEITCGEAPYLASRYDSVTGEPLPVGLRIGLLDRKLRVINENIEKPGEWLAAAKAALRATYAYEWQGDNLVLARENLLLTFIDYYRSKFGGDVPAKSLEGAAYIISWNVWQMDGLKGVLPATCGDRREVVADLFGETVTVTPCHGCKDGDIRRHNGIYALIAEWPCELSSSQVKHKRTIRYIDLIK